MRSNILSGLAFVIIMAFVFGFIVWFNTWPSTKAYNANNCAVYGKTLETCGVVVFGGSR